MLGMISKKFYETFMNIHLIRIQKVSGGFYVETDKQGLITLYENAEKMYEEGKLEEAISEFGKIIELAPKNQLAAKATNFIGDIYHDKEDYANTEVYFKEAIKIDPNLIEA